MLRRQLGLQQYVMLGASRQRDLVVCELRRKEAEEGWTTTCTRYGRIRTEAADAVLLENIVA